MLLRLLTQVLYKYNPLFSPSEQHSESLISDLKITKSSNDVKNNFDRNFYTFTQETKDGYTQFNLKITRYYEILLHLNHLILNSHLAYFYLILSTTICLILSSSLFFIVSKHLISLKYYSIIDVLLSVIDLLILSCIIIPIVSFCCNIIKFLVNHFPSPIHYFNDFIHRKLSNTDTDFDLNPIYYYSSESVKIIFNRGIELDKQVLDISKIKSTHSSTYQKASLSHLLSLLLRYHFSNTGTIEEYNQETAHEKRNQFIPFEDIEIAVIREGIFEDGLKSKVTSKNDKNGTVIDDRNIIIGQSCVSTEFIIDPIASLVLRESFRRKKKINYLSIILKSLTSREILLFETTRPKLLITKQIYKKIREVLNK